ncbi:MAG TPA: zf-HC2 domain-containing protein [Terracidiphilus sp.]
MEPVIVEISCVEVWREISNYVDDGVDPELKARMELHLKNCSHCRAVLNGTRNTVRLLTDGEWYPLPSGFSERLFLRLSSECRKSES